MHVAYSSAPDPLRRVARPDVSGAASTAGLFPGLWLDRVRPNPWTLWLVFHGQADLASRATLHGMLSASADAPDVHSLHLHLADLTFADVHAVTRLAALAAGLRGPDRAVMTCDPTPELRRIAAILDLTVVLGIA